MNKSEKIQKKKSHLENTNEEGTVKMFWVHHHLILKLLKDKIWNSFLNYQNETKMRYILVTPSRLHIFWLQSQPKSASVLASPDSDNINHCL